MLLRRLTLTVYRTRGNSERGRSRANRLVNQLDSGAVSVQRSTSEVHDLENLTAEAQEFLAASIAWPVDVYGNDLFDPAGPRSHDDDAVAHVDGFIDVVCDKEHGSPSRLP